MSQYFQVPRMPQASRHVSLQHGGQAFLQRRPNEMLHPQAGKDVHATVLVGQMSPKRLHQTSILEG